MSDKKYSNLTAEQIAKLKKLMKAGRSPIAEKEFQNKLRKEKIEEVRKEALKYYKKKKSD